MRLPKRVPWSSLAEFEQVCSWIFQDENDYDSQSLALNRLAAWKATTPLPHALESTMSLLSVMLYDKESMSSSSSHLSLRQSYGSAIIRLVNGFVDPLQSGVYARSIASIAQQIGLPSWLVEVRHAVTHEDLPSLELLREAARQSMSWLLHNYFLPTLSPSEIPTVEAPPLRPVAPLLAQYKSMLKTVTRDVSMKTQYKHEISSILREMERWISEAKVSANPMLALTSEVNVSDDEDGVKETWALEQLCKALLEPGAVIPLSKKKRGSLPGSLFPSDAVVSIWAPLLEHVQSFHPTFLSVFCGCVISSLLQPPEDEQSTVRDTSYVDYLSRWAFWAITAFENETKESPSVTASHSLRRETIVNLVSGVGPGLFNKDSVGRSCKALIDGLMAGDSQLEALLQLPVKPLPSSKWTDNSISDMQERMQTLQSTLGDSSTQDLTRQNEKSQHNSANSPSVIAPGIHLTTAAHWTACPIGVHRSIPVSKYNPTR